MYRRPLRSIARPVRAYVCLSCVSRSIEPSFAHARHFTNDVSAPQLDSNQRIDSLVHGLPKNENVGGDIQKEVEKSTTPTKAKKSRSKSKKKRIKASTSAADGDAKPSDQKPPTRKKPTLSATRKLKVSKLTGVEGSSTPVMRRIRSVHSKVNEDKVLGTSKPRTEGVPAKKDNNQVHEVRASTALQADAIALDKMEITALNTESDTVPRLSYDLERVLFNPGVYHLQDPRSRVFNFDPYLREIMPVTEFDFEALNAYVTSSEDTTLLDKATETGQKYVGSSSSMTGVLSQFHFLLSEWREVDTSMISKGFPVQSRSFTRINRSPAAVYLRYKDGVYAIDGDKGFDSGTVLMSLGKSMEKLLTMPTDQFERYRRSNSEKISEADSPPEVYHYSKCGDFLMRAQLDAYNPQLPGTGMFDLKTRAVISIRMMTRAHEEGLGYQIRSRFGNFESFEREYYDMIRSAFLKYQLQVRIGRMDGIFVAFHNVERIFGFQYVSLQEMDKAIHGQEDTALGDGEFKLSLGLWNKVLDTVTEKFPKQSVRFHFETRETTQPYMYIFAEPMEEEKINALQAEGQNKVKEFERQLFKSVSNQEGIDDADLEQPDHSVEFSETHPEPAEATASTPESEAAYNSDDAVDTDFIDTLKEDKTSKGPLLAMVLSARNVINGTNVSRPQSITAKDKWEVKYRLGTFSEARGWALYEACKQRRSKLLSPSEPANSDDYYRDKLKNISSLGRKWRNEQDKIDEEIGIMTYGEQGQ